MNNKWSYGIGISFAVLVVLSFVLGVASSLTLLESFRIVFGSVYVLFLPGFVLSFAFFPDKAIDWIERIALSFALSIAVVPLAVFYLNLIGVRINLLNSFLTVLGVLVVSGAIVFYRRKNEFGRFQNRLVR